MKGLKEVKYTDQWFKHQADKLSMQPTSKLKGQLFKKVKPQSKSLSLWQWVAGSAAMIALLLATQLTLERSIYQNDSSAMTIELISPEANDAFYNEMTSFLSSAQYVEMVKKYDQ